MANKFEIIASIQKSENKLIQIQKMTTEEGKELIGICDCVIIRLKSTNRDGTPKVHAETGNPIPETVQARCVKGVYFPIELAKQVKEYL